MTKKKSLDPALQRMIKEINNTPVSTNELIRVIKKVHKLKPDDRDFQGRAIAIIELYGDKPKKAKSIMFRLEALAQFLTEEGAPGWTLPLQNGVILTQEPVFSAAAVHNLIDKNGELSFEHDSFLLKVLELADIDQVG